LPGETRDTIERTIDSEIAEEIITVRSEFAFRRQCDLVQSYWEIGSVVANNPKLRKFGKGQGNLIATVARMAGVGERSLRYCVSFYEKFKLGSFEEVLPKLEGGKSPVWREIVKGLPSGDRKEIMRHSENCRHCPIHCKEIS
jgi:hypothetical protein